MHGFVSTAARITLLIVLAVLSVPALGASAQTLSGGSCSITSGCTRVELVSTIRNANGSTTFTWRVTSTCDNALSNIAFGLPSGVRAVAPGSTFRGTRNAFNVENGTNNPFYSVKFETIGEGIKGGQSETFVYTLPAGAPADVPVRIQAKSGRTLNALTFDPRRCTVVPPATDLSLSKSVCGDTERDGALQNGIIKVGNTLTYCLRLKNESTTGATGVAVRAVLPAGIEFVGVRAGYSAASVAFDPATRTITWAAGAVGAGATVKLEYRARITAAGVQTNVAEVSAADQRDVDSTPNNGAPNEDDRASVRLDVPASCTEFGGFALRDAGGSSIANAYKTDTTTTATLVVPEGACPVTVSLTSYTLGGNQFSLDPATQTAFDNVTAIYGPGTYTIPVRLPGQAFQVDLYTGCPQLDLGQTGHTPGGIIIFFGFRFANDDGRFIPFNKAVVDGLTINGATVPDALALGQSFPNPSAGRATIPFAINEATDARLDVFDVTGRRVATLLDGPLAAGSYGVAFDGGSLPSGLYVYRLTTGARTLTGRMTLVN